MDELKSFIFRFGFRGLMLDVSRNFLPKPDVLRMLDIMARYKLNHLHLHLSDNEGWRLEIPTLPELTEVNSHNFLFRSQL